VLRTFCIHGGSLVDTWPRDGANDTRLGSILAMPLLRDKLFVTAKIDRTGKAAGLAQFRETQRHYGRQQIDLLQVFSLTDIRTHWPTLQAIKAAGEARFIGATVSEDALHGELEAFLRRERPDFIQVNYSIRERKAEARILPLARDRGVGVIVNRPFMNRDLLARLAGRPMPDWARAAGIANWPAFALKYVLPHPAVTAVLTETTNPAHLTENMQAAHGPMPDTATRNRMTAFMDQV